MMRWRQLLHWHSSKAEAAPANDVKAHAPSCYQLWNHLRRILQAGLDQNYGSAVAAAIICDNDLPQQACRLENVANQRKELQPHDSLELSGKHEIESPP